MLSNAIRCSSGSRYVHREFAYKKAKGGGVYIASDVSFATRLRRTSALEKKRNGILRCQLPGIIASSTRNLKTITQGGKESNIFPSSHQFPISFCCFILLSPNGKIYTLMS